MAAIGLGLVADSLSSSFFGGIDGVPGGILDRAWPRGVLLFGGGAALAGIGTGLSWLGARFRQPGAAELLARDDRAPVVFLRSFSADNQLAVTTSSWPFQRALTLEERMTRALSTLGPVVALSDPADPFGFLGAARMDVDDDAWQQRVEELCRSAGWVVFYAGDSPSLQWEIDLITSIVDPRRVIVFIGGARQAYEGFGEHWAGATGVPWPPRPSRMHRFVGRRLRVSAFLTFDDRWRPTITWLGPGAAGGVRPLRRKLRRAERRPVEEAHA